MVDTVRTRAELEALFADNQAAGAVSANDVRDFIASQTLTAETGWGVWDDNTYTEGAPLAVNNARVQLTNDGANGNTTTTYLPTSGALWNTTTNKIIMPSVGSAFILRLDFNAKTASVNSYFDWQLDIGDGAPDIIIAQNTRTFIKGTNTEQRFSQTITGYALATFLANGCKIYIDSTGSTHNISVYDIQMFIELTHKPS